MTPSSDIVNIMTVDVEDYFQVSAFERVVTRDDWSRFETRVVRNTERVLRILEDAGVRATFFVLGWIAEQSPDLVRSIAGAGHEIASHGYEHRLLYDMTPEQFRDDLRKANTALEAAGAPGVVGHRAASYSITGRSLWALDVLVEEGYRYDSSIFPIRHDRYGIPNSPRHAYMVNRAGLERVLGSHGTRTVEQDLKPASGGPGLVEIPLSTIRLGRVNVPIAGGGYFRLFPYAWTRFGIRRLNRVERKPAVFYVHPWELDPGQPRLQAGWLSRFRHYTNLERTEDRLRQLLRDFRFGTISAALVEMGHAR